MVRTFWSGVPTFYKGLYEPLEDPSLNSVISWTESNRSFIIWNPKKLMHKDLYGNFLCSNFQRFLSRLEHLGFRKVHKSKHMEFGHKEFLVRGKPELLKKLHDKVAARRVSRRFKALKAKKEAEEKEVEEGLQNLQI